MSDQQGGSGTEIAALVLSLAAWPLTLANAFPGLIAGVLAVVLGATGLRRISGRGLAIADFGSEVVT